MWCLPAYEVVNRRLCRGWAEVTDSEIVVAEVVDIVCASERSQSVYLQERRGHSVRSRSSFKSPVPVRLKRTAWRGWSNSALFITTHLRTFNPASMDLTERTLTTWTMCPKISKLHHEHAPEHGAPMLTCF